MRNLVFPDRARTRPRPFRGRPAGYAFTLTELLVVMAVMAILLALTIPAFNQFSGGLEISNATDLVIGQFAQARQSAITQNQNIEVRLYSYKRATDDDARYCAMQTFVADDSSPAGWRPLGRLRKLPGRLAFDSGSTLSSLMGSQTPKSGSDTEVKIPGVGNVYTYVALTFRPDGVILPYTTNATGFFVTIKSSRLDDSAGTLPKNYAIVQIFPDTGLIRSYRP